MRWHVHGFLMVALLYVPPAYAEQDETQGWLTSRRAWSMALCSGSVVLLKKSWDFHRQADESYALYRKATTGPEAELFFERADNRDTKSQMGWMAAAAFALAGWQMLASGDKEGTQASLGKNPQVVGVEIEPELEWRTIRVGLQFKRRFF